MDIVEIKQIINESRKGNGEFTLSDVGDVQSKAKMTLEMDRDSQMYFYQITSDDLEKSSLSKEDVEKMTTNGWRFNENKNIFFKNI